MTATTAPTPAMDVSVLGDDIEGILDDLCGIHPALDKALGALAELAAAPLDLDRTQTVIAALAGASGVDVVSLVAYMVQRLTDHNTNPALSDLPQDRKHAARQFGQISCLYLLEHGLHEPATEASAAINGT